MTQQHDMSDREKILTCISMVSQIMDLTSFTESPTISKSLSELRVELAQFLTQLTIKEKSTKMSPIDTKTPEINLGEIL